MNTEATSMVIAIAATKVPFLSPSLSLSSLPLVPFLPLHMSASGTGVLVEAVHVHLCMYHYCVSMHVFECVCLYVCV